MCDEDREIPASTSNDHNDTPDKICESCGTVIDTSDWYPVTNERGADGSLQLYHFCSEDCQDAWLDERPE